MTVIEACFDWLADGGLRRIVVGTVNALVLVLLGSVPIAILVGWVVFWWYAGGGKEESDVFFFGVTSPIWLAVLAGIGFLIRQAWIDFGPRED